MDEFKINFFEHIQKLFFFLFNRAKNNNYQLMREYFAQILIMDIEQFISLRNKKILDVGGARGEFCKVLSEKRKCNAINLDPYPGEILWEKTVIGSATNLPFENNEFDLVILRGVIEHIPSLDQQKCIDEIFRITETGGICYILFPPWYNPHAGHNLKPFHILPFKPAKFLRQLFFKSRIEGNSYEEEHLYPITFKHMYRMISMSNFKIMATLDTHFRMHCLTKIPLIREILIPSVVFILKKE